MATADELLAAVASEADKVLSIDGDLRTIVIPPSIKNIGVESDEAVLRLHFSMPRMYGEIDLSNFSVRINYVNAKNEGDVYIVDDALTGDDTITFSWLVGRSAVAYKGNVRFIVCLKQYDENDELVKEFNTTVASLSVLEGLETSKLIVEQNLGILENILLRLDKVEKNSVSGGITILTGTADAPIVLRDLENGIYIIDGKVVPYAGGNSSTYSTNFAIVQKTTTYTYVQIMYSQSNAIHYYKISNAEDTFEKTTALIDNLEKKPTIVKNTTSTTITTQMADNLFYQCQNELSSLTLTFPNTIADDYESRITFKSGATPTSFTCDYVITWFGQDVTDNIFTPQANKSYYVEFYKNVDGMNAYVRIDSSSSLGVSNYDDLTNQPIENVISSEENIVALRDLESGVYRLNGPITPFQNSNVYFSFTENQLVNVITKTAGTHVQIFYPIDNTVQFVSIMTDDAAEAGYTYETKFIKLNKLQEKTKATTIELPASGWVAAGDNSLVYSQTVTLSAATKTSQVDLRPSPEQLQELLKAEISLTAANDAGTVTVFAIGGALTSDYSMQVIVSEVDVV